MLAYFSKLISQKHTNSTTCKLTNEIRNLNANFKRLESDVQVCKKVNDALVKQVASLERRSWRHKLYTQMESVKIISMLNWIVHSALEKKFWGETLIVPPPKLKQRSDDSEISRRKDSEQVMKVKKDLKDLNSTDSDFPEGARLFKNDTLCPYYRVLWKKHK